MSQFRERREPSLTARSESLHGDSWVVHDAAALEPIDNRSPREILEKTSLLPQKIVSNL